MIRIHDEARDLIEIQEHAGEFEDW